MFGNGLNSIEHLSLNEPTKCDKCGGVDIKYNGIGEYQCVDCGNLMYDDYGKVRNYIEENPGATASEVSNAVGVSKEKIRRLLREDKIQIAPGSPTFLHCESCGVDIRSGRYCVKCAQEVNKAKANAQALARTTRVTGGFGKHANAQDGAKRFDKR